MPRDEPDPHRRRRAARCGHDCRTDPDAANDAAACYAVVIHGSRRGRLEQWVVPLPAGSPVKVADWVLTHIEHCDAPLVPSAPPAD